MKTLESIKSAYASGSPIKLIYAGRERLCVVEHLHPTYIMVKQIVEGTFRTFSIAQLDLGGELTQEERDFARHYTQK